VVKLNSSLNKNITTARVTGGKVEVIIKQRQYRFMGGRGVTLVRGTEVFSGL
jgi:hypothetical protein